MKYLPASLSTCALLGLAPYAAHAVEILKADTGLSVPLNSGDAWVGGLVPDATQTARFDSTMATAGNLFSQIGGDISVLGIKVVDPKALNVSSGYGISASSVTSPTFAYTGTLRIGAGGIDFSAAQSLPQHTGTFFTISPPLLLTATQVWDIPNLPSNPVRELSLSGSTFTTGARRTAEVDLATFTVTKQGGGLAGFYFDRTVKNGTIAVEDGIIAFANAFNAGIASGDGSLNTTASSVSNVIQDQPSSLTVKVGTAGTLAVSVAPTIGAGSLNWNAAVELNGGTLHLNRGNYLGQLTLDGTIAAGTSTTSTLLYSTTSGLAAAIRPVLRSTLTGSGDLILNITSPRSQDRVILAGNNSGFTGNITQTGGHLLLNNPSGSATGSGLLTVNAGATLGGTGNAGPVAVAGILRPGDAAGDTVALGVSSATITGTLRLDVNGASCDRLAVTGALNLSAAGIELIPGVDGITATAYTLATAAEIAGTPAFTPPAGYSLQISGPAGARQLVLTQATDDYGPWAASFSLSGGRSADDDGDGLTNFQEYAFGLNPTSGGSVSPVTAPNRTTGTFTYTRRKPSLTGLAYTYQSSTTLGSWTAFTAISESSDGGDPVETITVTIPPSLLGGPCLFLRVEASEP